MRIKAIAMLILLSAPCFFTSCNIVAGKPEADGGLTNARHKPIASEKIIAESPSPADVFLYTPAIVEGFDGRFVVAVDYGGPGTDILDGPKSGFGDYKAGNQIRVMVSDDRGKHWKDTGARIPMMHEILFKAGKSLYMVGHAGILLITRSDDNGLTWSEPAVLCGERRWHQSCGAVEYPLRQGHARLREMDA